MIDQTEILSYNFGCRLASESLKTLMPIRDTFLCKKAIRNTLNKVQVNLTEKIP